MRGFKENELVTDIEKSNHCEGTEMKIYDTVTCGQNDMLGKRAVVKLR